MVSIFTGLFISFNHHLNLMQHLAKEITYASSEHEKAWFIRISINECQSMLRRWFHLKVDLSDGLSKYGLEASLPLTLNYSCSFAFFR